MRKILALVGLAVFLVLAAVPAAGADYQGRLLDGHAFQATVYGPLGAAPGVISFERDEAHVLMLDGEWLVLTLYRRAIDDTHFVTGKSAAGDFYRVDMQSGAWLYARSDDPFFAPAVSTPSLTRTPVIVHGGGRHSGGN